MKQNSQPGKPAVRIVADDRERHCQVVAFLSRTNGVELHVQRLTVGDYHVGDRLIVERKTLADFARSITDGRLFAQMIRLANAAHRGVLILEGTSRNLAGVTVKREAMQGALVTVSLILGIPVLRASSPAESAWLMVTASRQLLTAGKRGIPRQGPPPGETHRQRLHILQGLPGVGREKARRLLEGFGSVEAVFTADSERLQAIAGIGVKTAEKIREVVREPTFSYGAGEDWPV